MDAFMKKMRRGQAPFDDQCDDGDAVIPSELALDDDDPFMSSGFSGRLSFAGGDSEPGKDSQIPDAGDLSAHPVRVMYAGSRYSTCRVTFEVTSAEVIKESRSTSVLPGQSSHVEYTITLTSNAGLKDYNTCIVRRYSDFENLHKTLRKRFSNALAAVVFPQKVFVGNFSNETIAKRSRAFEQYLTHLYSILDIRYSSEFSQFFTGEDYELAMQAFLDGKYFQVIPLLERYLPVMEKLYGNSHATLVRAVCALMVSHAKTDRIGVADAYATLAMRSLPDSPLTVPLLQKLARFRWSLGQDKTDVEERLADMRVGGADVDTSFDLEKELCQLLRSESH